MSSEEGEIHGSSEGSDQQQEEQPLISFREKISTHKKTILVYDGFEYAFDKISRSDPSLEFYRCLYRGFRGGEYCPARLHVAAAWHRDDQGRYKLGIANETHRHPRVHESIREGQMQLRQQAADENPLTTRQAVDNARNIIPADVRGQQGTSAASMGRSYRNYVTRERAEHGDELLDRADPAQIVIPDRLQEQMIFDDVVDGRRMFVFASPFARNILAQYGHHVAIDGTFKCAPLNFTQLYTISVLVDNVAIPCVYGVLNSKSENTYVSMLQAVAASVPNWVPQTFMSDFESSALNAVANVYPNSERSGCLFYFTQAIYRRLQRIPALHTQFLGNAGVHEQIKCLFSLAFVPSGQPLYNYFCLLLHQFPNTPEVAELAHYFVLTWIGCDSVMGIEPIDEFDVEDEYGAYGLVDQHIRNWIEQNGYQQRRALFPMEIWNMCARIEDNIGRTNNSVEAWHGTLNAQFRCHSPRFSTFLRVISKEENHWRLQLQDYEHNPANGIRGKGMKRKQTDVEQDLNLRAVFNRRAGRHPLEYLRAIAHRMAEPL